MKKMKLLAAMFLSAIMMVVSVDTANAKSEKKTCVLNVAMDCQSCVKKVNNTLRFEKGMKKVKVNLKEQNVVVTYDAKKTSPDKIVAALEKKGFKASVSDKPACTKKKKCTHKHDNDGDDHGHSHDDDHGHDHDGHDHDHGHKH